WSISLNWGSLPSDRGPAMTTEDERTIDQHADRLCHGLDLADPGDVVTLQLRLLRLGEHLEAEVAAIDELEAEHAHIEGWIGAHPMHRAMTLRSESIAVAWGRAIAAGGVEPDTELVAELARNRAILA